jgi:hypothetical protein
VRILTTPLLALLSTEQFVCADLYEITLGATTYYLTSCDRDLVGIAPASVETYVSTHIDRERIRASSGLEVDDLEVQIAHDLTAALGSKSWGALAMDGDLDEAPLRVFRAYLQPSDWSVVGCYSRFEGVISTADPGSTTLRIVAKVNAADFGLPFPGITWEEKCIWNLTEPGCDYAGTVASYTVTPETVSTSTLLVMAALPGAEPITAFAGGTITRGAEVRTVVSSGIAVIGYWCQADPAFSSALGGGGDVVLAMGCSKLAADCETAFANLDHFMGAPLAPWGGE